MEFKDEFILDNDAVNSEMVGFWIGSDATLSELLELLTDIANGQYTPQELKNDVLSHSKDM